jgi:uncharacterized protein YecE (DUF72 family)
MTVTVGTSGWQYRDWRGSFYPKEVRQADWLDHYAQHFSTVEINASFYRLPPRERFEVWARTTPPDFVLCPKVSRYLTHMKKLSEPEEPVERFAEAARGLGDKAGPWLLQLPPNFGANHARLECVLQLIGGRARVAVELRHRSWFTSETRALLERHGTALVWADRGSRWISPTWRTADWGYVRFHEGAGTWPCYGRTALSTRAEAVAAAFPGGAEVFAFFNNDPRACAVRDARWFAAACRRSGLAVTRTPGARDVKVVRVDQPA